MATSHVSPHQLSRRVWLVASVRDIPEPADRPTVRDDLMRTWRPEGDCSYRCEYGKRCATWAELHARFDLVEVPASV